MAAAQRLTYVLIPGAGSSGWLWHLVEADLRGRGHDVVAVDLPCDDDAAGLAEYVDTTMRAIGDRQDLVLVGHSMGGFTAPLVCEQVPVRLMVLIAAMVPVPGEPPGEWWENTGWHAARAAQLARDGDDSPEATFLHDVSPELVTAVNEHVRDQSGTPFEKPWPLARWPDVATKFVVCTEDRFFPAPFLRRVVEERLGIEPDDLVAGHLPMLSRPHELAERLVAYAAER
jgi:pimeloyl-ACP methyl ester carboxylesterase